MKLFLREISYDASAMQLRCELWVALDDTTPNPLVRVGDFCLTADGAIEADRCFVDAKPVGALRGWLFAVGDASRALGKFFDDVQEWEAGALALAALGQICIMPNDT